MISTDKPLTTFARIVFGFVAVNALAGALSLMLLPSSTDVLFFWEIKPPINAALFGALYFGGAGTVGYLAWRGQWEPSRFLIPVLVSAGFFISLTTLMHLGKFTPGIKLFYWLLIYIGAPLLALFIYWQHEHTGANWRVTEPVTRLTLGIAGILGVGLVLLGVGMILVPDPVVANWPWQTSVLMLRIFASWFAAFGVGLLWFWIDREWQRVKYVAILMIAASALDLAMVFVHRDDLATTGLVLWIYLFHLTLFGVLGGLMLWWQQRAVASESKVAAGVSQA
jgi:hypothetical protein